jgi:DNA invertase Pin-like site-specific DNA recombinase
MGYIMHVLEKKGKARLHSVTEENDCEDDPIKLMMIMMKTFGSTMERIAMVERMQEARKRKQAKGGFIGGTPPMGYKSIPGTGKLRIEENEIEIVKEVFSLRDEGKIKNFFQ